MSSTQAADRTQIADLLFLAQWEAGGAARPSDYLRARQIRRAIRAQPEAGVAADIEVSPGADSV